MYESVNNLQKKKTLEIFLRDNHIYNLSLKSELTVPSNNTIFKDQNFITYFESIL